MDLALLPKNFELPVSAVEAYLEGVGFYNILFS
jgi:hypothetical protein